MPRFKRSASSSIDSVTHKRVTERGHMHSYLMRSARFEPALYMSKLPKAFKNAPMSYCLTAFILAATYDRHSFSVDGMSANRRVNSSAVLTEISSRNGVIYTLNAVVLYLLRQKQMRRIVFSHH